ncbi:Conserved_hypothetical protein [Hexamita inflata]|uniref:C2H2-type domain-containing protein n=1 Tax=Hexamita inflata TaxID=28002 RepID=A0AA86PT22_9EUKA|nr:Conserved hypothetical protein [Hexamita inflata]
MQQQDNTKNAKPREFKCRTCLVVFDTHEQLMEHVKIHPIICKHCQNTFQTIQELKMHLETAHEQKTEAKTKNQEFKCQTCSQNFLTQKALNAHIQKEHQVVKQPAITFKCQQCAKIFKNVQELNTHNKQEHTEVQSAQPLNEMLNGNKTDQKVKEMICEKCKEIFNNRKELNEHKSQKHPQCSKCKIEFETVEQQEQHKLLKHPDVPKAAENEHQIQQVVQKQERFKEKIAKQDTQTEKKPNGKNRDNKQSKENGKQVQQGQIKQDSTVKAKNQQKFDKLETKQTINAQNNFVALTARIIVYLDNEIEENNLLTYFNKLNKSIIKEDSQLLIDCDVIDLEDVKQQIIQYQKILKYTIIIN